MNQICSHITLYSSSNLAFIDQRYIISPDILGPKAPSFFKAGMLGILNGFF